MRDCKSGWHQFKHNPIFYKRVKHQQDGALPVLTGGYCVPVNGKADWSDPDLLEKDINPELYTLRELYYSEEDVIPEWHNTVFLDIEIEMGGALTIQYIKDAQAPITSIALIDSTTKTKICFIVDKSKEIEEIEDRDDPLTGTAGIEYRVDERADRFALFLTLFLAEDFFTLFLAEDFFTLFLTLRFADAFLAAFFFAAT